MGESHIARSARLTAHLALLPSTFALQSVAFVRLSSVLVRQSFTLAYLSPVLTLLSVAFVRFPRVFLGCCKIFA